MAGAGSAQLLYQILHPAEHGHQRRQQNDKQTRISSCISCSPFAARMRQCERLQAAANSLSNAGPWAALPSCSLCQASRTLLCMTTSSQASAMTASSRECSSAHGSIAHVYTGNWGLHNAHARTLSKQARIKLLELVWLIMCTCSAAVEWVMATVATRSRPTGRPAAFRI